MKSNAGVLPDCVNVSPIAALTALALVHKGRKHVDSARSMIVSGVCGRGGEVMRKLRALVEHIIPDVIGPSRQQPPPAILYQ